MLHKVALNLAQEEIVLKSDICGQFEKLKSSFRQISNF
jgi:hypothetical protein